MLTLQRLVGGKMVNVSLLFKFTNMKYAVYGWNHYHVGKYDPIKQKAVTYPEEEDIHSVHSFFGLTYIRLANNQGFVSYPANP